MCIRPHNIIYNRHTLAHKWLSPQRFPISIKAESLRGREESEKLYCYSKSKEQLEPASGTK